MKNLIIRYAKAHGAIRDVVQMLFALTVFYSGALIQDRVVALVRVEEYHKTFVEIVFVFVLASIFVGVRGIFRRIYERTQENNVKQRRSFENASAAMQRIVAERIRETRIPIYESTTTMHNGIASMGCLQDIVKNLYSQLEGEFGESELLHERIEFEVTFMALSYVDKKITIPAFANRNGRAPVSMILRQENSGIYDSTVTAELFQSDRPEMRIVQDTSVQDEGYTELYKGQLDRIKSSIIYPVLDDRNVLLGTLVAHCNRTNFFRHNEALFWRELLERYAVQLAFEKSRFDLLEDMNSSTESHLRWAEPF